MPYVMSVEGERHDPLHRDEKTYGVGELHRCEWWLYYHSGWYRCLGLPDHEDKEHVIMRADGTIVRLLLLEKPSTSFVFPMF